MCVKYATETACDFANSAYEWELATGTFIVAPGSDNDFQTCGGIADVGTAMNVMLYDDLTQDITIDLSIVTLSNEFVDSSLALKASPPHASLSSYGNWVLTHCDGGAIADRSALDVATCTTSITITTNTVPSSSLVDQSTKQWVLPSGSNEDFVFSFEVKTSTGVNTIDPSGASFKLVKCFDSTCTAETDGTNIISDMGVDAGDTVEERLGNIFDSKFEFLKIREDAFLGA